MVSAVHRLNNELPSTTTTTDTAFVVEFTPELTRLDSVIVLFQTCYFIIPKRPNAKTTCNNLLLTIKSCSPPFDVLLYISYTIRIAGCRIVSSSTQSWPAE